MKTNNIFFDKNISVNNLITKNIYLQLSKNLIKTQRYTYHNSVREKQIIARSSLINFYLENPNEFSWLLPSPVGLCPLQIVKCDNETRASPQKQCGNTKRNIKK